MNRSHMLLIVGILLLLSYYNKITLRGEIADTNSTVDSLTIVIDSMRVQLDAQTEHYRHCLWLSNDDIGTSKNGYLYVKKYAR